MLRKGNDNGTGDGFTVYVTDHDGLPAGFYISGDGTNAEPSTSPIDGTWHFVKARYTLATRLVELGIDGGAMATRSISVALVDNTENFYIGGMDHLFAGNLSNIFIYDRVLSDAEFAAIKSVGH